MYLLNYTIKIVQYIVYSVFPTSLIGFIVNPKYFYTSHNNKNNIGKTSFNQTKINTIRLNGLITSQKAEIELNIYAGCVFERECENPVGNTVY